MTSQPASDSRTLVSLLIKANELRRQKKYREAIAIYLKVLEQFGENADSLAVIASSYSSLAYNNPHETGQNHQDAVTSMEKAVALAPKSARPHARLAQYYWLGLLDYESAAQEYRKAIELNPNDVWVLVGAAALYGVPERVVTLEEAIDWLRRATQLEPDDPNYHARLGEFYHEAGRIEDAKREWLRALTCPRPLDPGYVQMIEETLGNLNI